MLQRIRRVFMDIIGYLSLIWWLFAGFIASRKFTRFFRPLYTEKCSYNLVSLSKGVTEILSIVHNKSDKENNSKTSESSSTTSANNRGKSAEEIVIVFFSGNPGFIRFYDRFLSELDKNLNGQFDIFGVGHLGQFNYPKKPLHNPFSLQDQVAQKAEYLRELAAARPNAKFILISHSIGTYMALNVMENVIPQERIVHSIMLYPVIERINETPNGRLHAKHPYFPYIYLSSALIGLVSILPKPITRFIVLKYLERERGSVKEDVLDVTEAFSNYASYSSFYSMLYMTRTEFTTLHARQEDLLVRHADKMFLYYGEVDDWCPKQYYFDMKAAMPKINAQLDKEGFLHAFVIGGAIKKAAMIAERIQNIVQKESRKTKLLY